MKYFIEIDKIEFNDAGKDEEPKYVYRKMFFHGAHISEIIVGDEYCIFTVDRQRYKALETAESLVQRLEVHMQGIMEEQQKCSTGK